MTALADAFQRLGIRPTGTVAGAKRTVPADDAPDFSAMPDDVLAACMRQLDQDVGVITEELDVDLALGMARGERWRHAAGRARAYKITHLRMAKAEQERRTPKKEIVAVAKKQAETERMAAEKALAEVRREEKRIDHEIALARRAEAAAKAAEAKAAAHVFNQTLQAKRDRAFVSAAFKILDDATIFEVWAKARELRPGLWEPLPETS
jgi:hypothetical protein